MENFAQFSQNPIVSEKFKFSSRCHVTFGIVEWENLHLHRFEKNEFIICLHQGYHLERGERQEIPEALPIYLIPCELVSLSVKWKTGK